MGSDTPSTQRAAGTSHQPASSSAWYEALADACAAGLVVLDTGGNPVFVTRLGCELLQVRDVGELKARWADLSAPVEEARTQGRWDDPFELTVQHDATLLCRLHETIEGGDPCQVLTLQRAELVARFERSLRQSARHRGLVSLYREMAHDIKGSLNALALNVEVLARAGAALDPDARLRSAFAIRTEIDRLDRTIAALLDRSVLEGASRRHVDVRQLLEGLGELVRGRCRTQGVRLETDVHDEPLMVDGWPDQLHTALLNLCINALDAMPEGGRLLLWAGRDGDEIRVCVSDTGQGVPAAERTAMWRLFYSTRPHASGVGLHVVQTVARAHDGRAELVEAPSGFQTCFQLSVPVASGVQ